LSALYRLSGINLLLFYGGNMFSNIVPDMGNFIQPIIGFTNFAPIIPAYFLIGRYGRKSILTVCSFLMTLTMIGSGVSIII
jgi:Sugar (and other) transporter